MPELPEVETFVRSLRPLLVGRKIIKFETDWERGIKAPGSVKEFARDIVGQKVVSVERRAKYLVFKLTKQAREPRNGRNSLVACVAN